MSAPLCRVVLMVGDEPDSGRRSASLRQKLSAPGWMMDVDDKRARPPDLRVAHAEAAKKRRREGAHENGGSLLPQAQWIAALAYVVQQCGNGQFGWRCVVLRHFALRQQRAQDVEAVQLLAPAHPEKERDLF